jgi:hypothetical protein
MSQGRTRKELEREMKPEDAHAILKGRTTTG